VLLLALHRALHCTGASFSVGCSALLTPKLLYLPDKRWRAPAATNQPAELCAFRGRRRQITTTAARGYVQASLPARGAFLPRPPSSSSPPLLCRRRHLRSHDHCPPACLPCLRVALTRGGDWDCPARSLQPPARAGRARGRRAASLSVRARRTHPACVRVGVVRAARCPGLHCTRRLRDPVSTSTHVGWFFQ